MLTGRHTFSWLDARITGGKTLGRSWDVVVYPISIHGNIRVDSWKRGITTTNSKRHYTSQIINIIALVRSWTTRITLTPKKQYDSVRRTQSIKDSFQFHFQTWQASLLPSLVPAQMFVSRIDIVMSLYKTWQSLLLMTGIAASNRIGLSLPAEIATHLMYKIIKSLIKFNGFDVS